MNNLIAFLFVVASLFTSNLAQSAQAVDETVAPPNIVFLFADDQSTYSVGCYGNEDVQTPNMDMLARDGMAFDKHYNTTAICMASRSNVFTGMYEYKTGCNFTHGDMHAETWEKSYPVLLREAGYLTAFAGKFGIVVEGKGLCQDDFDFWGGGPGQTQYKTAANKSMAKYAEKYPHSTLSYGAFGQDVIRESVKQKKPFCLSISFKAPHKPATPDPRFNHVYAGKKFTKPANYGRQFGEHLSPQSKTGRQYERWTAWNYDDDYDNVMATYHQQVHAIDVAVGMVREELKAQGVADNTVIIYTSDNGFICGSHGYGSKVLPMEESSRVPLMIYDPRVPLNGKQVRCNRLTGNIDFAPTILELAGLPIPENMDGHSLLGLLKNPEEGGHEQLAFINVYGPLPTHSLTCITRQHKYTYWWYSDKNMDPVEELFDLHADPLELTNVVVARNDDPALESMRQRYDIELEKWKSEAVAYNDYQRYGVLFDRNIAPEDKEEQKQKRKAADTQTPKAEKRKQKRAKTQTSLSTFSPVSTRAQDPDQASQVDEFGSVTVTHSALEGIGVENGVMRRDPSDVIKVGNLYYVWYSKGTISPGYDATVWYATSTDGQTWDEKGMALAKGAVGTWEGASVFTPNIMVAENRYWLFYTGTSNEFRKGFNPDSKIGIAVSDSPDGPWQRLATNPALSNSADVEQFDSHLVDDACLLKRGGKYWFYYKGRQQGKSPSQTQMGLAIADRPQGPYVRHASNPVIPGNHEVLVWPHGEGVAAMIGTTGPKSITNSVLYAEDGVNFTKTHTVTKGPWAGGAYRPAAFNESGLGEIPKWGVEIGRPKKRGKGNLPFIGRFDVTVEEVNNETDETNGSTTKENSKVPMDTNQADDDAASVLFSSDLQFMKQHTQIVLLKDGDAAVAVAPAYQGRVMTSTFNSNDGPSLGWINRPVIEKGFLTDEEKKGTLEEHIYIFGGEERFWLGPEGGQYAIFFKPGAEFDFSDWTTPPAIDTEPFELVEQSETTATFRHSTELLNHSGTKFNVAIDRTVKLVGADAASKLLGVELSSQLSMVGYETDNRITNTGDEAWKTETGLLSIWILGMYNPSPTTTVVIPFKEGSEEDLGTKVNDTYFGKVPSEYLRVEEDKLFFKGDGTRRGKIGVTPERSKGIAGSYDAAGQVLNIVTYNVQDSPNGFVNSMWELQKQPYVGDVINSYNDGSPEEGAAPLGPFYELETSSPAAALQPGGTMQHIQRTFHIKGTEEHLNLLAKELLGVSLDMIKDAF